MFDHRTIDITLPAGWHRRSDLPSGVLVSARPLTIPPSGWPPEVVVRVAPVDTDLLAWRDEAQAELSRLLPGFAVSDADSCALGGHDVDLRRFSHASGAGIVITAQWSWVVDGAGITLTCSSARGDHPTYRDLFEQIARTVTIAARAA
jgi:hypothetical protein